MSEKILNLENLENATGGAASATGWIIFPLTGLKTDDIKLIPKGGSLELPDSKKKVFQPIK